VNRPRVLADFMGVWALSRRITHATGTEAGFEGTAVWQPGPEGALYRETGVLVTGAQQFQAERAYLWSTDLTVCFDDGRYFHKVPPLGGTAAHWCDPDQYNVTYDFDPWPDWQATWHVRGPRKDYTMVSRYRRQEGNPTDG